MTPKETFQRILEQHNQPSNTPDDVLFNIVSPYCIYKDLAGGSPYSDDEVSKAYVTKCMDISSKIYRSLNFGSKLLVVYEDCYSENKKEEIQFVESCLNGVKKKEAYSFSWKYPHMDETYFAALDCNDEVYTCTRILYEAENIDVQRLFLEIILSDIGGKYDLDSKIFIIDTTTGCIFHLYDDRGLWVSGSEGMYFPQLGKEHDQISDMEYEDVSDVEMRFIIRYKDFSWVNGTEEDSEDLCLHGMVSVLIGAERFAYNCCVSAAALRMLRTLTENHEVTNSGEQMLPCCGNSMIADEAMDRVMISGCDLGVDWVVSREDRGVRLITATGKQVLIDRSRYRKEILLFADAVENFYKNFTTKVLPESEIEREGYQAFWKEWHWRKHIK